MKIIENDCMNESKKVLNTFFGSITNVNILNNLGIMKKLDEIISANNYDTYGNPSLCTTIKTLLEALTPGTVVAMGTYDATSCTQDLRDALTTYFGDNAYTNTWASQRISQMFLGKRNSTG